MTSRVEVWSGTRRVLPNFVWRMVRMPSPRSTSALPSLTTLAGLYPLSRKYSASRPPAARKVAASLRSGLPFGSLLLAETDAALRRELPVGSEADFVPVGPRLDLALDYCL